MIPDIDHISMGFRNVCKMREGANLPKMMPSKTLVAHTSDCCPHNKPIFVPNGNAGSLGEIRLGNMTPNRKDRGKRTCEK
jgi:hypothetical protein